MVGAWVGIFLLKHARRKCKSKHLQENCLRHLCFAAEFVLNTFLRTISSLQLNSKALACALIGISHLFSAAVLSAQLQIYTIIQFSFLYKLCEYVILPLSCIRVLCELNVSNLFTPRIFFNKSTLESRLDEEHQVKRICKKPSEKNKPQKQQHHTCKLLFELNALNEPFECLWETFPAIYQYSHINKISRCAHWRWRSWFWFCQ